MDIENRTPENLSGEAVNPKPEQEKPKKYLEGEENSSKLEDSPRFRQMLEEESLNHLKTNDSKWFYENFSGEVSSEGYLIDKNGKETNLLPSQNIGADFEKVKQETIKKFQTAGRIS